MIQLDFPPKLVLVLVAVGGVQCSVWAGPRDQSPSPGVLGLRSPPGLSQPQTSSGGATSGHLSESTVGCVVLRWTNKDISIVNVVIRYDDCMALKSLESVLKKNGYSTHGWPLRPGQGGEDQHGGDLPGGGPTPPRAPDVSPAARGEAFSQEVRGLLDSGRLH